ncbi:uncharacterized protein LOC110814530 [Carica papaya]|uniref:uncharacterized protein LOC110814530 n=1 Tax=Carica papaya TaxID=3649 RepID=UPI000B8D0B71|nr:uncharacterized protein LOC110814530 [Carica papaya]
MVSSLIIIQQSPATTRFLKSLESKILRQSWTNRSYTICPCRLPILLYYHSTSLHHHFPIGTPLRHPHRPFPSLFRPPPYSLSSPPASMTTPQPAPDSHHSSSDKTVRVVIKGWVQGVFYRNWTIENASELGLKGWVRNRRDGSVEALFSGNPDAVQEMEQRCRRGPPDALVTGLQVFPSSEFPGTEFVRKPTV